MKGQADRWVLPLLIRPKGVGRDFIHAAEFHNPTHDVDRSFVAAGIKNRDSGTGIRTEPLPVNWMVFRGQ